MGVWVYINAFANQFYGTIGPLTFLSHLGVYSVLHDSRPVSFGERIVTI